MKYIRLGFKLIGPFFILFYLGWSFSNWDINPANWNPEYRDSPFILAIIFTVLSVLLVMFHEHKD
jgi:hypothetical protein